MQTQKMSLANIQGKLSRTEMKNIMAGSADGCLTCTTDDQCAKVNKGTCTKSCLSGNKGCNGW